MQEPKMTSDEIIALMQAERPWSGLGPRWPFAQRFRRKLTADEIERHKEWLRDLDQGALASVVT